MQFYFINNYEGRLEPWILLSNTMDNMFEKLITYGINQSSTAVRLLVPVSIFLIVVILQMYLRSNRYKGEIYNLLL